MEDPISMNIKQVADYLRLSEYTIWRYATSGILKYKVIKNKYNRNKWFFDENYIRNFEYRR